MTATGPRVPVPQADIEAILAADARLAATMSTLDDLTVRQPSRLPDWTVGHVLTHIARNADSVTRRLEGSRHNVVVDQYPGGPAGRAAEIDEGARRDAATLVADVTDAAARLQEAIAAMPDDAWGRLSRTVGGALRDAASLTFNRWREIEVHHVDLGLGYGPDQWPDALCRRWLEDLLPTLADRSSPQALLGWVLGRGPVPELRNWE